ncbi:MFS transporter [uncultured Sphingobium sp.]|uniref:MFS transporter n=1 Tax=uncultured Sphingobium sp. TaxID=316087 RepID=UPI002590F1E8|nr:MFS transporter [uncultured Sphingobium sp.]
MRKVTWRLLPFLMLCYLMAFIDRANVGMASLQMNADLGLSSKVFGFGASLFFVAYFLMEVPSNLMLQKVGARYWIARIMVTWGMVSTCMAFVWDAHSFYVMRFLLGAAEAGFFPGVILYLTYWMPPAHRGRTLAMFAIAIPVSSFVGSPLSGLLLAMDGLAGLRGWQWLFICEGIPTVLLGFACLKLLTDRPEKANWLDAEERAWLTDALVTKGNDKPLVSGSAWRLIRTPAFWAMVMPVPALRQRAACWAYGSRNCSNPSALPTLRRGWSIRCLTASRRWRWFFGAVIRTRPANGVGTRRCRCF